MLVRCSTPIGITADITPAKSSLSLRAVCAQRLSASRRTSHSAERWVTLPSLCSTPIGITADITPLPHRPSTRLDRVLNAYRHHGGHHSRWAATLVASPACSTPIGITADITRCGERRDADDEVLNAYRHHGGHHFTSVDKPSDSATCSTPIGITADITGSGAPEQPERRCAQRLSASRRTSLDQPAGAVGHLLVLNAYRHHGGHHSSAARRLFVAMCAQRLSASRRTSLTPASFVRSKPRSAQRLSASRRTSLRRARNCSSAASPGAQRLSASRRTSPYGQTRVHGFDMCSTPIGITADITGVARPPARRPLRVLNAYRHHGGHHPVCWI